MKSMNNYFLSLITGICMAAGPVLASAQGAGAFPQKPVKMVVPFPAAGTTDLLGRAFAKVMGEEWKVPVIVENRAGAGGNIGTAAVARAEPDGYTIVLGTFGTHGVSSSLIKDLSFDPQKDFEPVTLLALLPNILVVNPNIPAKSLKELVDYAKANPGKLTYASAGVGTASHIAGEYLKSVTGIDVAHAAYKGSAPALADVMAGHVAYTIDYLPSALPFVQSGKLRGLATTGTTRSASAPDIPTAQEAGLKDFNFVTWYGIFAPAKTPRDVVKKIRDTMLKAADDSELKKVMASAGVEIVVSEPEELAKFQKFEIDRWAKLIKSANITAK